jgi:RHS repeat-associated protein
MVFVSAGMQEIAEYEQGTLKRIYVYGSYIDEPLMMTPIGGGPVKKYYYHANNLYNVAAITDKNGVVVERYNYSPYGEATILDPTGLIQQAASSIQNPLLFTGRRLDAETGLMYYRARYYDVDLGRFIGRDPFGYVDGMNMYQYVRGNSLINLDPEGTTANTNVIYGTLTKSENPFYKPGTPEHPGGGQCPKNKPSSNGCGTADWKGKLVPEMPLWMVSFTPACNLHDICYGTCGKEKKKCDDEFRDDMYLACYLKWGSNKLELDTPKIKIPNPDEVLLKKCFALADAYHLAVSEAGGSAYDSAQRDGCKCLCDKGKK